MPHSFGSPGGVAAADNLPPSPLNGSSSSGPTAASEPCWPIRPTLRNELDTFSVHFYIFFGPNVSVPPDRPATFAISLLPVLDSGGTLNLELRLNVVGGWVGGEREEGALKRSSGWVGRPGEEGLPAKAHLGGSSVRRLLSS